MARQGPEQMGRRRAILTDDEREQLVKEEKDNRYYQAVTRVRTKIEDELTEDIRVLKESDSNLLEELRVHTYDQPPLAKGVKAYVGVNEHPRTERNEVLFYDPEKDDGLFEADPIPHIAADGGSDKLTWDYRGGGSHNTAESILTHASNELGLDNPSSSLEPISFMKEYLADQSGEMWALPFSDVQLWIEEKVEQK